VGEVNKLPLPQLLNDKVLKSSNFREGKLYFMHITSNIDRILVLVLTVDNTEITECNYIDI